jgi:outer membrane protein assembly factor BamB
VFCALRDLPHVFAPGSPSWGTMLNRQTCSSSLTRNAPTQPLDGSDCHAIWLSKWSPRDYETLNTQRGAGLAAGKIIRGTADGFLLALDTKDGQTVWANKIADSKEGYFISMPPLAHGDLVYFGPAGAEWASEWPKRVAPETIDRTDG